MAKFIKSIFNTDKKQSKSNDSLEENREDFTPPLDIRRKLSISRSGRMKQNKKRRSLSLEVYGDNYHLADKQTSKEYHVHGKAFTQNSSEKHKTTETVRKKSVTPDEEIDNAFQIIDKAS